MSMFYFAIVATSISAHITVESSQAQAKTVKKQAFFEAVEDRKQAAQEMEVAAENARRKQGENRRILAALRAESAASGFQMTGTPLAVFGDTAMQLERDILDMSFEAENRRRNILTGAENRTWEAEQQASGIINSGIGSALGTAASGTTGAFKSKGYLG